MAAAPTYGAHMLHIYSLKDVLTNSEQLFLLTLCSKVDNLCVTGKKGKISSDLAINFSDLAIAKKHFMFQSLESP